MTEPTYQAEKLRDFVSRGGDPERWWESKGFSVAMRQEIVRAYECLKRGVQ